MRPRSWQLSTTGIFLAMLRNQQPQLRWLTRLAVPYDKTVVEVSAALLDHPALDGLDCAVTIPPIVGVTPSGNYITQGTGHRR